MGVFDKIKNAIWGKAHAAPAPKPAAAPAQPTSTTPTAAAPPVPTSSAAPQAAPQATTPAAGAPSVGTASQNTSAAPTGASPQSAPQQAPASQTAEVDVEAMLDAAVADKGQKLDWRHSIVDLMKALDLDSSLADRKELAQELHYTGDTSDSATMNIWLHKALMKKLADNGGKVPADLMD
jgi:hypothetical protein